MAVNKARTRELIAGVNSIFDTVTRGVPDAVRRWLKEKVLGTAVGEIEKLVEQSRPPVLYVMGRSGHGKSSLINALAGRRVAEVGHVKPQTPGAEPYLISFREVYAEWQVIDSRGIFETTAPDGAPKTDAVEQVKEDVRKYRPDVILHVVAAAETRTLSNDFKTFDTIQKVLSKEFGTAAPAVMVLTKVDVLGDPRAWPLEEHPKEAALVKEVLDYVTRDVLKGKPERIDPNSSIKGYRVSAGSYVGVVPVSVREGDEWNVETLSDFVGRHLPESALLDYCQALQRKEQLRRISSSVTRRFSATASGIGASPVPIADIAVLTPLQLLLVAFIAGLSCRSFSLDSAKEFTAATGVNLGAAFGARQATRQLVKLAPGVGTAVSGAMAGATTYGIGKAAEAYFFTGKTQKPARFIPAWLRSSKHSAEDALL